MMHRNVAALSSGLITLALLALLFSSAPAATPFQHLGSAHHLAFSGDGKKLAAITGKEVVVWDVVTGTVVRRLATPSSCYLLDFSPKGDTLAMLCAEEIELWDIATAKRLWSLEMDEPMGTMYSAGLRFSPDGKCLVLHADSVCAYLLDLPRRKVVARFGGQSEVHDIAFSHDGKRLALATFEPSVQVFDLPTGNGMTTFEPEKNRFTYSVCFDRKDQRIAAGGWDRITIVEVAGAKRVDLFQPGMESVHRVAFVGDGRLLVSGSQDGKVRVWDIAAGKVLRTYRGYHWTVSPDGKTLALSAERTVRLWDAVTGEELVVGKGRAGK